MHARASVWGLPGLQFRLAALFAALSICVGVPLLATGGASAGTRSHSALTSLELGTLDQINAIRERHGLGPLRFSRGLFASASLHCEQMVEGGYFGHQGLHGSSFDRRLASFYPQAGHTFYQVGENLLWATGHESSTAMVRAWMHSPPHRENLLDPNWTQIGVAALSAPSAPGVYSGRSVIVVTVDFGVRH